MPFTELQCNETGRVIRIEPTLSTLRIHGPDGQFKTVCTVSSKDPVDDSAKVFGLANVDNKYDRHDTALIDRACDHLGFQRIDFERYKNGVFQARTRPVRKPRNQPQKGPWKWAFFIASALLLLQSGTIALHIIGTFT